jgi:hypothetical protein
MPSFDGKCNGEKFQAAAKGLDGMIGKFGASEPQVKQWMTDRCGAVESPLDSKPGSNLGFDKPLGIGARVNQDSKKGISVHRR